MKPLYLLLIVLFTVSSIFADEFVRNLPDSRMIQMLTPEKFPNMDAVIILKEQSFQIQQTEYHYRGITLKGPSIIKKNILIVKLLNERAVARYGNFEYSYFEYFGNEIPNDFVAHVRVLKENGKIWKMPKKSVNIQVSRELSDGTPISRKALFKIPDLAAGDVLQMEYEFIDRFSRTSSAIFYYNARDLILYSNLYITLPNKCQVKYISLPQNQIGEPTITDASKSFGSGKTYFWSVRNLKPVPDEPLSYPFEDQSLMTAFIIEKWYPTSDYYGDWLSISRQYFDDYLSKDKIDDKYVEKLGFSKEAKDSITFETVDSLYTALRKMVALQESNSIYPLKDHIESIFKNGKGDASDMAYAMYQILHKWDVDVKGVWIRDKRDGIFEAAIPTIKWFDRLGVLVNIGGKEQLYDFDRCIPSNFSTPWFLRSVAAVVLDKKGGVIRRFNEHISAKENIVYETHTMHLDNDLNLSDSVHIAYKGSAADEFRGHMYGMEEDEINKDISKRFCNTCLQKVDSLHFNNFGDEPKVELDLRGTASSGVQVVDNYVTFKPDNEYLGEFRDKLFSTLRRSHILLNSPFLMMMNWNIDLPEGYGMKTVFNDTTIAGPGKMEAHFRFFENSQQYQISLQVAFPDQSVHVRYYPQFMKFLDSVINNIGRDIVLEKI